MRRSKLAPLLGLLASLSCLTISEFSGAQSTAKSGAKFFAFINGGYTPGSNTWIHEQDILAFKNTLFVGQPTRILSASGADATFAEVDGFGNFLRKPDGYVTLKASQAGKDVQMADFDHVKRLYADIKKANPSETLIVHGDHGSRAGLSLWNDNTLLPDDHFKLQNSLPKEMTVRSIHIQCHAGTLIVPPLREPAKNENELKKFVDENYPPNRCGLALSRHDETGQYNTQGTGWENSPWTEFFRKEKPATLAKLKDYLNRDGGLAPTTITTSDYYMDDMAAFLCRNFKTQGSSGVTSSIAKVGACTGRFGKDIKNVREDLVKDLCDGKAEERRNQARDQLNDEFERWANYQNILRYWAQQYLRSSNPEFASVMKAINQMDYYAYQGAVEADPVKKAALYKKAEDARVKMPANSAHNVRDHIDKLMQRNNRDFVAFVNKNCTPSWLQGDDPKKILGPYMYPKFATKPAQANCLEDLKALEKAKPEQQLKFKEANVAIANQRQELMNELLSNPQLSFLKDRYEQIKKCEAGAIN